MYEIVPGILEKTWEDVEEKIVLLSPFAKSLHIDVIDGKLAPNLTLLDPKPFAKYKDQFLLEAHLMVEDPIQYVSSYGNAGFKRLLGNVEKMPDIDAFIAACRKERVEVGLALDGPTDIAAILPYIEKVDCLQCYVSDRIGFSGPPMMPERLTKVKALRLQTNIPIEVDGGVKDHTILQAKTAGATRFVATSFISGAKDPKAAYEALIRAAS